MQVGGGGSGNQVVANGGEAILDVDDSAGRGSGATGRQVVGFLHVSVDQSIKLGHDGTDGEVAVVVVTLDVPVDAPAHGFHIGGVGSPRQASLDRKSEDEVDVGGVGFAVTHDEVSSGNTQALVGVLLVGEVTDVTTVARRGLEEVADTLLDGRVTDLEVWATRVVVDTLRAGEVNGASVFDETTGNVTFVVDERVGEDAV